MIELENERRYLHQWALDQRVQIDNFLPGTWVEFSLVDGIRTGTLITEAYEECGHVFANIPNALLQNFGYLHVYVNPPATDMVHTPEEKDYKIVRRQKPGHYIYTETPTVSYNSKVDIFWGEEHAGKHLVVGDDGYITAGSKIASEEEVKDALEDTFDESGEPDGDDTTDGENPGTEPPGTDTPGGDNTGDENHGDNIATDEEVNDMFEDVFG